MKQARRKNRPAELGTKKPLILRGMAYLLIPLILRNNPPELAPFLRRRLLAGGLPGFVGPFPSTSLDESDNTRLV